MSSAYKKALVRTRRFEGFHSQTTVAPNGCPGGTPEVTKISLETQSPSTKSSIQSQTHWKENSRKTEIQVGG
jgi:hypothetical protein